MKASKVKRVVEISQKTVFETGDPKQFIRANDVAFLITELELAYQKILMLESQLREDE